MSQEADPFIEVLGLTFTDHKDAICDYCTNPQNGFYYHGYDDDWLEICGKCVVENQKQNNGRFVEANLPPIILPV